MELLRSTSLGSHRSGPISKGESPGRLGRTRGTRPNTLTHAYPHTCNMHTPGRGLYGTERLSVTPTPLSDLNTIPWLSGTPSLGHPSSPLHTGSC